MTFWENEYKKRFANRTIPAKPEDQENLWESIARGLDADETPSPQAPQTSVGTICKWLGLMAVVAGIWLGYALLHTDKKNDNAPVVSASRVHVEEQVAPRAGVQALPLASPTGLVHTSTSPNTEQQQGQGQATSADQPDAFAAAGQHPAVSLQADKGAAPGLVASFAQNTATPALPQAEAQGAVPLPKSEPVPAHSASVLDQSAKETTLTKGQTEAPAAAATPRALSDFPATASSGAGQTASPEVRNPVNTWLNSPPLSIALLPPSHRQPAPAFQLSSLHKTITAPTEYILPPKKRTHPLWCLSIASGAGSMAFRYRSSALDSVADAKSRTEKSLGGYNNGIYLTRFFGQHRFLQTGLEHHTFWSKLDYQQVRDVQVLKKNQLMAIVVNIHNPVDTLKRIYGDTLVTVREERTVIHYNQYRQWALPLEFGLQHKRGRLVYGFTAGPAFYLTTLQSGKVLNTSGQIVAFDSQHQAAPFQKFGLGLRGTVSVGCQVAPRWTILLRPRADLQMNTKVDAQNLSGWYRRFDVNLGIQYKIK